MIKNKNNLYENYLRILTVSICLILFFSIILSGLVVGVKGRGNSKKNNEFNIKKFQSNEEDISRIQYEKIEYKGKGPIISVYIAEQNKVEKMPLEEYVLGVVVSEMQANFHEEALKAQAVAARTYAVAHMKSFNGIQCKNAKGADICDTVHCQVYMKKDKRIELWPKKEGEQYWKKIEQAVKDTYSEVIFYNKDIIKEPYYFAISGGKTENAMEVFSQNIPYLKSVESPGEEIAQKYESKKVISNLDFIKIINSNYPKANLNVNNLNRQINIMERTEGGGVKKLKLGKEIISGTQFRKVAGLNSASFTFGFYPTYVEIKCKGYGHRVGMSQWGANAMGKAGKNYKQILEHYYKGTKVRKLK